MLQNVRVTAFTVFELLRENILGVKITPSPLPPRIKTGLPTKNNYNYMHVYIYTHKYENIFESVF